MKGRRFGNQRQMGKKRHEGNNKKSKPKIRNNFKSPMDKLMNILHKYGWKDASDYYYSNGTYYANFTMHGMKLHIELEV